MKSLKYLTLSILSLSIASVGYAAAMSSGADHPKEAIKNKLCNTPGSCGQGQKPKNSEN